MQLTPEIIERYRLPSEEKNDPYGWLERDSFRGEKGYLTLLAKLFKYGVIADNRTSVPTQSLSAQQLRFDVSNDFTALLTTKKVHHKSVRVELEWFLKGLTNAQFLQDRGVTIWDEWATEEKTSKFGRKAGNLGPVYGHQWRNYGATFREIQKTGESWYQKDGIDQIQKAIDFLRGNPDSRRIIVNGWNPIEALQVELPPCHTLFQFISKKQQGASRKLDLALTMRSADMFLGVPFNIASYAFLIYIIASITNHIPGELIVTMNDCHMYQNHKEQAIEQLSREIKPSPSVIIKPFGETPQSSAIDNMTADHIQVINYHPHPAIKAPVAV